MSKYALNLDEDSRILSATYEAYAVAGMPVSDTLPDGDITDYKYINNEYVYDPLPKPEPAEQTTEEQDALNLLINHEERLLMLELGLTEQ